MADAKTTKKYYWLKLKRDFFKRHDIRIIEEMPNGKDYILFYLKLLLESIDHEGALRFNETIPYSEQMLSVITNTNIDLVRSAMRVFTQLKMVEILDDETIYMTEVQKMTGAETAWAQKKRLYRGKQEEDKARTLSSQCPPDVRQEIEKEKEIEKELDIVGTAVPKQPKRFKPPSVDEVRAYCRERKNMVDAEKFIDYYTSNGWKVGKNNMKDWKAAVRTWERNGYSNATPKEEVNWV
jgi:predicted phage replisome organizer